MSEPSDTPAPSAAPTENERTWGMLAHLSALAGVVVWLLGCVLGPLAVCLSRRDQSEFVAEHAREALNFNITVALAAIVCMALMVVFVGLHPRHRALHRLAGADADRRHPRQRGRALPLSVLPAPREIAPCGAFTRPDRACPGDAV